MPKRKHSIDSQPSVSESKKVKLPPAPKLGLFQIPLIRNKIYHFGLVNKHHTSIIVDEPSGWDGERLSVAQIYNDEDLVRLTTKVHHKRQLDSEVTVGLMRINSTIHTEAATILYGHNTFSFMGRNCWLDLIYFESRLTEIGRRSVRNMEIRSPEIDRAFQELDSESISGLKSLKRFPGLGSLTLHLYEDILTSDITYLRKIRHGLPRSCRVVIDIHKSSVYYRNGGRDHRPVRISSGALEKLRQWNWAVKGDFELIDQSHRMHNEERWLKWLRDNHRTGVTNGLVEERSLMETCIFGM
ncbi:MAG: hypothetical protein Q9168_006646 [Polycauliona sp. 1 TL-2023]